MICAVRQIEDDVSGTAKVREGLQSLVTDDPTRSTSEGDVTIGGVCVIVGVCGEAGRNVLEFQRIRSTGPALDLDVDAQIVIVEVDNEGVVLVVLTDQCELPTDRADRT